MKKTFLAMLLLGSTLSMFAQNTPTEPTTNPTTTPPTTNEKVSADTTRPTTVTPAPTTTTTDATMPMNTTPATTTTTATWNGVSTSASWTPETAPAYGWNNYRIWNNMGSMYPATRNSISTTTSTSVAANNGNMSSTGSYSAYGTPVSSLPANVQMRFNQDFPTGVNNSYSWNQYGDWFHTHYISNGRLWQYHYSQRGDGYALVLPVVETYVPENIINNALQKYGSNLYSIAMVKTNHGVSTYQLGLLQNGQLSMQYLDENGASVADVWRTEDSTSMNAMQSNAAMDSNGNMNNSSMSNSSTTTTESMSTGSENNTNGSAADKGKSKLKIKNADGSIDKVKMKNGQLIKQKSKPAPSDLNNNQQ